MSPVNVATQTLSLRTIILLLTTCCLVLAAVRTRGHMARGIRNDLELGDSQVNILDHNSSRALLLIKDPESHFRLVIAFRDDRDSVWYIPAVVGSYLSFNAMPRSLEYSRTYMQQPSEQEILRFRHQFGYE